MVGSFPRHPSAPLPPAQDPPFAHAGRHAALIEELEERDRVLPGDAKEVLDIRRTDLLALPEHGDELLLDRIERPGVEEERLLDAEEPSRLDEHLEELVLLVPAEARAPERLVRARRCRLRPEALLLDLIHDALLLGCEPHLVRREPHLVALALHDALRLQSRQERRKDALVGAARPPPQLLPRHAGSEGMRAVEGRERADDERAQAAAALRVEEPVAVHDEHAASRHERVEEAAQALGAEGHAAREGGEAYARGADVAAVLLQHDLGAAGLQEREV